MSKVLWKGEPLENLTADQLAEAVEQCLANVGQSTQVDRLAKANGLALKAVLAEKDRRNQAKIERLTRDNTLQGLTTLQNVAICEKCGTMYDPKELYEKIPGYNAFSPLPCCHGQANHTISGKLLNKVLDTWAAGGMKEED